jgi:hypothetical protein
MLTRLHRPSTFGPEHTISDTSPLEQVVDILELQLIRLREEREQDWDTERAEGSEDGRSAPGDGGDGYGCYLDDGKDAR